MEHTIRCKSTSEVVDHGAEGETKKKKSKSEVKEIKSQSEIVKHPNKLFE